MGRILALDWGRKRIGVAISDPSGFLATPHSTLKAFPRERLWEELGRIIEAENISSLIVGLPFNMDGSEGASAGEARKLVESVRRFGLPVEVHDERLTSFEAERLLREMGKKPSRDKAMVDKAAAAILLQDYLDSHREKS